MSSGSARALAGKLRLEDLSVEGRRVLLRADLNLPVRDGEVTDDTRLVATLPTLTALRESGAAVVVMSHRGRPKGERREDLGMAPVADAMRQALDVDVRLLPDCIGDAVETAVDGLQPGDVALLENLRFHAGETANDAGFAAALARLAEVYVNDAFGAAHRAHASTDGVPRRLGEAAAGLLLSREVEMLSRCLEAPEHPFALVAGGAKVSDKLDALAHLMPLVDQLIIGGAMANAVLAAQGVEMGASRIEEGAEQLAAGLLETAAAHDVEVLLPEDFIVAPAIEQATAARAVREIPAGEMALDIGPASAHRFASAILVARTVLWNGPMGVFEVDAFSAGTAIVGGAIAALAADGAFTVVGGGDTAAAVAAEGIAARMSHVSTGGGASLDLLSGAVLPGIAALTDRPA